MIGWIIAFIAITFISFLVGLFVGIGMYIKCYIVEKKPLFWQGKIYRINEEVKE